MTPLFSVIIPCCDVADYVVECLDSLRRQRATWECLVVIEESKDATEAIIRQNVGDDPRFKIFTEPRSGSPATPRNTGLKHALGEYVVFMDGDDTFEEDALSNLQDAIVRQPDGDLYSIVMRRGEKVIEQLSWAAPGTAFSGPDLLVGFARRKPILEAMVPLYVYRRAFLAERNLRFVDGLLYEDEEFSPRAIYSARKIVATRVPFYCYRIRNGQITGVAANRQLNHFAVIYRSLFHFFGTIRPEVDPGKALARLVLNKFLYLFFHPQYNKIVSIEELRTLMDTVFQGGTADFLRLADKASLPKRVGARLLASSWKMGLVGLARHYFWLYFRLVEIRDRP